jgi:hypothetical protein
LVWYSKGKTLAEGMRVQGGEGGIWGWKEGREKGRMKGRKDGKERKGKERKGKERKGKEGR